MSRWVIEEFDRESGRLLGRHGLAKLSDDEVKTLLGLPDLGSGDLYDVSRDALIEISLRFGLKISPVTSEYLLGRESSGSS
ncbi:DUF7683 domain-containing protein [Streptomyces wuyuanensis]|uniref:DUF7683 domain-containing protein n=1 Tax=Streptomyces wuyuanensis TaxID=1196353 RepID=UPI003F4CF6DB